MCILQDILLKMDKLKEFQSKGGKARAKKYDKKQLSDWSKKGGRPIKKLKLNKK